jgi:hypothetical protein
MRARIIVCVTLIVAWFPKFFLFFATGGQSFLTLLLPAAGGFYPWATMSGEPTYYPKLMFAWFTTESLIFLALASVAFITRSTKLAIFCSLLWFCSIAIAIYRFLSVFKGIY